MVAISLVAAVAMTWPLARVFGTRFCGGFGDPQLTLWSMRWLRDALASGQNPFFTPRLYHPQGTTLVFHTFDLPSSLLVLPLWGLVPEIAIYNTAVLLAFALTAYGMARLARELTGDDLCGVLAGILFAGVPYHYAHLAHLHLLSMGWVPLYVLHLLRLVDDRGGNRDALLGGLWLALASLASWYHLFFAAVITVPLVIGGAWHRRGSAGARRFLRRSVVLGLVWLVLAGPLLAAMIVTKQREDVLGAHDAAVFSADAATFFDPAAMRLLADGEHATFVGFTVAVLALLGAMTARRGREFLVIAVIGGWLTLGPVLQWKGDPFRAPSSYAWLEWLIPGLAFGGVPVRFGYVMYFGLIGAAALGLARLRRAIAVPSIAHAVVVAATGLALWEYWPGPATTSQCPLPAPMRAWAADERSWAVLDVSGGWSQMWHATIHRKPIVGGYLGRVPKRLEDWIAEQPVLAAIVYPDGSTSRVRIDGPRDFGRDLSGDRFSAEWTGKLLVPTSGLYGFRVHATADAFLDVAGVSVARAIAPLAGNVAREGKGSIGLRAGARPIQLRVFDAAKDAMIEVWWATPGEAFGPIPAGALRTAAGETGLDASYSQHMPVLSGLGRARGRAALRGWSIRYVVTGDVDNASIVHELALPEVYRGEDVRIYEVPSGGD